jgi:hypothetical protein
MGYTIFTTELKDATLVYAQFIEEHCIAINNKKNKSSSKLRLTIEFCVPNLRQPPPPNSDSDNNSRWTIRCTVHETIDECIEIKLFSVTIEYGRRFSLDLDLYHNDAKLSVAKNTDALRFIYAIAATLPRSMELRVDSTTHYVISVLERMAIKQSNSPAIAIATILPTTSIIGKLAEMNVMSN